MDKSNRKRKPLSDITNTYNLIPTPDLANLVGASVNPGSVLSNKKLRYGSTSRPGAGIGSPDVTGGRNSRPVQLRTPPRAIARQGDRISKDKRHTRKQTIEEITKEKRKNKGITTFAPFSSSPPDATNHNQNELLNTSSEKQKGRAYRSLYGGPVEMPEESNKLTPNSSSHLYEKAKGIVDYSNFSLEKPIDGEKSGMEGILKQSGPSVLKIKEIGKESVDPLISLAERINENEKPLNPVGSSIERTREKGKAVMELPEIEVPKCKRYSAAEKGKAVMQFPGTVEVRKSKRNSDAEKEKPLNPVGSSIERTREKGKAVKQLPESIEITKRYSAAPKVNTRPSNRKSTKRKIDAGIFSCPPMTRSRNPLIDLAGDLKSPKLWTDAHPKPKKKSRLNDTKELPPEFVEQQNAYYKEIDAFELPEEEVSEDELD